MEKSKIGMFRTFLFKLLIKTNDKNVAALEREKIKSVIKALENDDIRVIDNVIKFINNECNLNES